MKTDKKLSVEKLTVVLGGFNAFLLITGRVAKYFVVCQTSSSRPLQTSPTCLQSAPAEKGEAVYRPGRE